MKRILAGLSGALALLFLVLGTPGFFGGPRFGLFAVDYANDLARTARPSADLYRRIIREGISEAMWREYQPLR